MIVLHSYILLELSCLKDLFAVDIINIIIEKRCFDHVEQDVIVYNANHLTDYQGYLFINLGFQKRTFHGFLGFFVIVDFRFIKLCF